MPGHDKAVAAVVTGAAQHDDGTRRPAPLDLFGDTDAGILHQFGGRQTGVSRETIGLTHLVDIQQGGLQVHLVIRKISSWGEGKAESRGVLFSTDQPG